MKSKLSHQATILPVSNVEYSIAYYTKKLGFICTFKWEKPASYAVLKRDGITINLNLQEEQNDIGHASIYIFCHDIKSLYKEYKSNDVVFEEKLNSTDYGMNEFAVKDLDNNRLIFGQGVDTN
jgi:hypothetical protein